jgi:hypothetical protein
MAANDNITRLPYPKTMEAAADLAVETTFQKMGEMGAFDECGGISESAMIFGKACAWTAINQIFEAATPIERLE